MKITPRDIARSLVDAIATSPELDVDEACMSAILLLRKRCPGITPRMFVRLVEREVKRQGTTSLGLLVVPHEHSISAETIQPLIAKKSDRAVHIDRMTNPDLIGGAVLLVEHRRIDCSVQGALAMLLKTILQPID